MTKKLSTITIVNEFIKRAGKGGVTHMQLQKLTYLAHEQWLKDHDDPFLEENPQVWTYGPVFANLYHQLKHHKKETIKAPVSEGDGTPFIDENDADTKDIKSVIDQTWSQYGHRPGTYLSNITHLPDTPWRNLAEAYDFIVPEGLEIKPENIIAAVRP